jgi:hypothetical protein
MSLCHGRWIASFLAMTGQGRNDEEPCHCEARSAVAIHAFVPWPMDRFVPRDDGAGAAMTAQGRDDEELRH